MSEVKTPRLMAAAKEFNIGTQTLIDFLVSKSFGTEDLKPSSKLSEDMYRVLQQEFQQDKVARQKAEQIDLPKGAADAKKKKDEEDLSIRKKEEKVKAKKDEVETVAPPPPPPPVEEAPPAVPEAPVTPIEVPESTTPPVTKIDAPELEGPKVVTKIDLGAINQPKGKKTTKKAAEEPAPEATSAPETTEAPSAPVAEVPPLIPEVPKAPTPADLPPVIENIQAAKLTGPKILGKIELPIESDTRPKREDEKSKRKRIPVKKAGPAGSPQRPGSRPGAPGAGGNRFQPRTGAPKREERVIDEKEIQDKLKQTQAKLAGNTGRGKSAKAKLRRAKREEMAEKTGLEGDNNKLQVTEFVTVSELAGLMDVSFADIISKCMSLGIMVSINQRLEADVIELVASEFGFEVEFIGVDDAGDLEEEEFVDDPENLIPRAPIVTIMGHVDHGKTSLLDYIRNANVIAGEAGGITQHIGAYEVTTKDGRAITFLDTPGHEAFTAMRARGAKVTDIAVIVIAADDAVMPQTKEAISHAQAASVPMIFALNKMDKDGANPEKIKEQLAGMNILVESWGGKYQSQEISAKKGMNVDLLLEKILLETDILELKANPSRPANGTVIEASLDKGRGYVATILVQNGTLKTGDMIVSGQFFGKVKAMYNERNQKRDAAPPSTPVLILGLNGAPQAGETFKVYENEAEAREMAYKRGQILREQGIRSKKHITLDEIGRRLALGNFKELNVIIKGDVDGSVEALSDSLQKLSTEEILVKVIHKAVGAITESDVTLANASDAIIIGFNVRPSIQAARLAETESIEIKTYSIIYNAIEEIKSAMEGMLEPTVEDKVLGNVEIRETYRFDKATVAGCYVLDGKIARNNRVRLIRDGIVIYTGELASLKRFRDDVKEVSSNMECGLVIRNYNDIKIGDIVEAFEEVEVKRTL
ncbi:MAG TPA: translation initiation factor IF-2 [Ferruginibacter sp.]|nr:translation initiation factor IF-2 [Ferruginibacter sp.]HRN79062.1 translation initiation factor IF-2 [Ferruginibacter sp.]HRQ20016.1 translation initiation factor IF-2 [Ferruginibacter sp.]